MKAKVYAVVAEGLEEVECLAAVTMKIVTTTTSN